MGLHTRLSVVPGLIGALDLLGDVLVDALLLRG
jgi:hypothetical protein